MCTVIAKIDESIHNKKSISSPFNIDKITILRFDTSKLIFEKYFLPYSSGFTSLLYDFIYKRNIFCGLKLKIVLDLVSHKNIKLSNLEKDFRADYMRKS